MIDFVGTFIFFFAVIDPAGALPIFISVTRQMDERGKRRVALIATLTATGILVFFVVAGEVLLKAMHVPLPSFQIAGGIVLFLFALTMIFGEHTKDADSVARDVDIAIFPLAVPAIASPGAMLAAVLLTENAKHSIWEQTQITLTMLAVLLVTYLLLRAASRIHKLIGSSGSSIISRVMGLILASIATTNVLDGIKLYFQL